MAIINKPSQPLIPAEIDPAVLDSKADLVNGEVPSDQLPSYVDDVLEFADSSHFPEEGESGKIYVALDTNFTYRWSGTAYIQVGGGSADKPLNMMQFNVPEGWSGDMYALLKAQDAERFEKWIGAAYEFGNYCIYDQLGNYYEFLGVDKNHARILIKLNQGDASNDDGILALISGGVAIQDEGGNPQLMVSKLFPINYRLMPIDTLKLNVPEKITHLPHEWTESDLELVLGAIAPREAVRINEAATANGSTQFYDQFEHRYLIVPSGEYCIWYVSLATEYNYGNRISRSVRPQFYAFAVKAEARSETGSVTVTSLGDAHYATDRDLASKQDTLVSGTNIKTINGNSVLGEGDLVISGGAPFDPAALPILTFRNSRYSWSKQEDIDWPSALPEGPLTPNIILALRLTDTPELQYGYATIADGIFTIYPLDDQFQLVPGVIIEAIVSTSKFKIYTSHIMLSYDRIELKSPVIEFEEDPGCSSGMLVYSAWGL